VAIIGSGGGEGVGGEGVGGEGVGGEGDGETDGLFSVEVQIQGEGQCFCPAK